jgi:site-specific recombinase XerD
MSTESIDTLIAEWMEFLFIQKGHKARGVEQYEKVVRGFFQWLRGAELDEDPYKVSQSAVNAWQRALFYDKGNMSNSTRAMKLSALRSFFSWMKYTGLIIAEPTEGVPSPKIQEKLPQKFSVEELRAIFSAPDRGKLQGLRDLAILMTLYAAGPRVSELCNLDTSNVHDSGGVIRLHFQDGKGGKDRTITIRERPAKILREWLVARSNLPTNHRAVFVRLRGQMHTRLSVDSAQDILKKHARSVGIIDAETFVHKLRSTFASDLYDSGDEECPRCRCKIHHVDLLMVQLALGHEDPKTTMPYIAISDRHLRKTSIPNQRFKEIEEG